MTETTTDEVKQTLAEYERLALSTGAKVQIDPPEFSENGVDWSPVWITDLGEHPGYARVTVHRDGIPTTVYVAWDEALPAEESWRQLWQRKPMTLFGAFTIRAALRRAFREVIGDRHEPDDMPDSPPAAETPAEPADWETLIADVETPEALAMLHHSMKLARAVTPQLEVALHAKRHDLTPDAERVIATTAGMPRPKPAPPAVRPEDTVRRPRKKGGK